MKSCKNLDCVNNKNGFCSKEVDFKETTVYDTLNNYKWNLVRKHIIRKRKNGVKPLKKCKNLHCINNISGGCFLPSEMEVLSVIL